jgi:hypothetical protein
MVIAINCPQPVGYMIFCYIHPINQIMQADRSLSLLLPVIAAFFTALMVSSCWCYRPHARYDTKGITFRACYEGTQNQAVLYLYGKDHSFIIHASGILHSNVYRGKYGQRGDTLLLYPADGKRPGRFAEMMRMDSLNKVLVPVQAVNDSLPRPVFYYGFCKGEN